MITHRPLFYTSENNDTKQMHTIISICGAPNEREWPEWKKYDKSNFFNQSFNNIPNKLKEHLYKTIPKDSHDIIDLLLRMLRMNPKSRITAEDALNHPYFHVNKKEGDVLSFRKIYKQRSTYQLLVHIHKNPKTTQEVYTKE